MSAEWGPRTPFAYPEEFPPSIAIRPEHSAQRVPRLYLTPGAFREAQALGVRLGVGESAIRLAQVAFDQELAPQELTIIVHTAGDEPDSPDIFRAVAAWNLKEPPGEKLTAENVATPHALFVPAGDWSQESLVAGFLLGLQKRGEKSVESNKVERVAIAALPIAAAMLLDGYLQQRLTAILALGAGAGLWYKTRQLHERLKDFLAALPAHQQRFSAPLFVRPRRDLDAAA